jgi:hypothetical protein
MDPGFVVFLIPLAGIGALVALGLPLVRGVVRYLERKGAGAAGGVEAEGLRSELDELRARLELVENANGRLTELEERLDFAERLLTQQRAHAGLPGGEEGHAGDA